MDASSGDVQVELPPSVLIGRELIQLRQYEGMSVDKLREKCPLILALPVVTDELEPRNLNKSDRAIAASRVITCAVRALIVQTNLAKILTAALNIDATEKLLDGRRRRIQLELFLSDSEYRRVESRAFSELAATLVAINESPCGATVGGLRPDVAVDFQFSTEDRKIVALLSFLGMEPRPAVRELLADATLESFDGAREALRQGAGTSSSSSLQQLEQVIQSVLLFEWPPRLDDEPWHVPFLSAQSLYASIFDKPEFLNARAIDERIALSEFDELGQFIESGELQPRYFEFKRQALSALRLIMTGIEQRGRWVEVLSGNGSSELVEPV